MWTSRECTIDCLSSFSRLPLVWDYHLGRVRLLEEVGILNSVRLIFLDFYGSIINLEGVTEHLRLFIEMFSIGLGSLSVISLVMFWITSVCLLLSFYPMFEKSCWLVTWCGGKPLKHLGSRT